LGGETVNRAIIWGLATKPHTHRYIHQGFFETFQAMGWEAAWVDDLPENNALIKPGDLIISVDIASNHLVNYAHAKYILHNVERPELKNHSNVTFIQVFTHRAKGESVFGSRCLWNQSTRTLYQPWGIPSEPETWLEPQVKKSRTEFWVGSVWNNELNQGNSQVIADYKIALRSHGYRFRHLGGVGGHMPKFMGGAGLFSRTELTEIQARDLVARSPIGAAVVGQWQQDHGYVPCRIFKNLAAGQLPLSNADFSAIFGGDVVFNRDFGDLIEMRESLAPAAYDKQVEGAQYSMRDFTYRKAIERILQVSG
jgi:hypothetical protein